MKNNFKILKKLVALLLIVIVPVLSFEETAYAQSSKDEEQVALCTTKAVLTAAGINAGKNIVSTVPTGAAQGLVSKEALASATVGAGAGAASKAAGTSVAVPVADAILTTLTGTIAGVSAAHASLQDVTKMNLDMLAYSLAQCALTQLTNNTIAWIQGGFNGSPKFSVDLRSLTEDIAKGVSADFANQIRNLQSCDFTPNFIDDLADRVDIFPQLRRLPPKIQCPFPAQNVLASDFYNAGSGIAGKFTFKLMETALGDNGNRFGVNVLTNKELAARQAEAKATNDQKLSWSNGFTDIIDTDNCNFPQEVTDIASEMSPEMWAWEQKQYCKTTTPGKVIGDTLMKQLGVKTDRIGFADNMNKLISALIDELTSEAVHGIFKAANNATPAGGPSHNPAVMGGGATGSSFSTGTASTVSNGTISKLASTTVTLDASITFTGSPLTTYFIWTTSATDILTPTGTATAEYTYKGDPADATNPPSFSATLTGLTSSTTYNFRAVGVTNAGVRWYGAPQSFTTAP